MGFWGIAHIWNRRLSFAWVHPTCTHTHRHTNTIPTPTLTNRLVGAVPHDDDADNTAYTKQQTWTCVEKTPQTEYIHICWMCAAWWLCVVCRVGFVFTNILHMCPHACVRGSATNFTRNYTWIKVHLLQSDGLKKLIYLKGVKGKILCSCVYYQILRQILFVPLAFAFVLLNFCKTCRRLPQKKIYKNTIIYSSWNLNLLSTLHHHLESLHFLSGILRDPHVLSKMHAHNISVPYYIVQYCCARRLLQTTLFITTPRGWSICSVAAAVER